MQPRIRWHRSPLTNKESQAGDTESILSRLKEKVDASLLEAAAGETDASRTQEFIYNKVSIQLAQFIFF